MAGTVVDGQGKPIAGASVTIQTSDGQHPHATRTDSSGQFQFVRFEAGQYDLRAYGMGKYSDWAKRVLIRSGKITHITLRIMR
jgi:protocatechuate 3,4-dioxygenase beta subunit